MNAVQLVPRTGPAAPMPYHPLTLMVRMANERGKTAAVARALLDEMR